MKCFVYKSIKKREFYLYITKKDDFSCVSDILLAHLGELEFVLTVELTPYRKLAKETASDVIAELSEKGYFVQLPHANAPISKTDK